MHECARSGWTTWIGLAATVIFSLLSPTVSATEIDGQASIIDGDTIEIHGQRIRLFGIDAPEHDQLCEAAGSQYRCGQQAALALADQIGGQTVDCVPHDVDRYGRIVAVCSAGGEDFNAWMVRHGWAMVRQGWALAYRHYSTDYGADEDAAHLGGRWHLARDVRCAMGLAAREEAGIGSAPNPVIGLERHASGPVRHQG